MYSRRARHSETQMERSHRQRLTRAVTYQVPESSRIGKFLQVSACACHFANRVCYNRKWFSNSRVISQESLSAFREAMSEKEKDPYTVLLKSNKLPLSLIRDGQDKNTVNGLKQHQAKMTVETSPYADIFGPKSSRKRVKLSVSTIDDLAGDTVKSLDTYHERREEARLLSGEIGAALAEAESDLTFQQPEARIVTTAVEPIFSKGQSKRIWNELCTLSSFVLVRHERY